MTFYLIGLGLNEKGISIEGAEAVKKCKKVYLERYTVDFPYSARDLEKTIGRKIIILERNKVESSLIIKEAKKENIALLVYGSPLFATTHISLILDAEKQKAKTKIIYSASVFDAIAETGLQLYKFGKTASMPKHNADFLKYALENKKIRAHSLILADIGLSFKDALLKLEEASKKESAKIDKVIVCSNLGTNKREIFYGKIENLKSKKAKAPFCFIIPAEMHFMEKEALERIR